MQYQNAFQDIQVIRNNNSVVHHSGLLEDSHVRVGYNDDTRFTGMIPRATVFSSENDVTISGSKHFVHFDDKYDIGRLGNNINITIHDAAFNDIVAQNLEMLVRKLNSYSFLRGARFTSGGFQRNYYMKEIPEFVVLINNQHILTSDKKFRLAQTYQTEKDIDELAKYFLSVLETC